MKIDVMTKDKDIKTVVPALRFPEFRDGEGWVETTLKSISPSIFDGTHQTPKYTEVGVPFYSVENIVSGNKNKFISEDDHKIATLKNCPAKGDILITRIGTIGFSKVVDWNFDFSIYVTLAVVKKSDHFISNFLHQYFQSSIYQSEILSKSLLDAVPCKINMDELRNTRIFLPPDKEKKEQAKIADFLGNLDDLRRAVTDKIETLKEYKKGLMQQLFPAKGKTIPAIRFPEFQNAPDWQETALENIGEIVTGNTPSTKEPNNYGGDRLFVSPADISDKRYVSQTKTTLSEKGFRLSRHIKENSILFVCIGSTIGKVAQNTRECATNQQINSIMPYKGHVADFVYSILEHYAPQIASIAGNQAVPIINKTLFSSVSLLMPKENEQQKIADCLSSVDELISTETAKLDQLKAHKKGLMQQLFPKLQ